MVRLIMQYDTAIVYEWDSDAELREFALSFANDWVLLESGDTSNFAFVGPVFSAVRGVCFECYSRRRAANGGGACIPLQDMPSAIGTPPVTAALSQLCDRSNSGRCVVAITNNGTLQLSVLLPLPHCGCFNSTNISRPDQQTASLLCAVDSRVGLVHCTKTTNEWASGWHVTYAIGSHMGPIQGHAGVNDGLAASHSNDIAVLRAVAESLERYSAGIVPSSELLPTGESLLLQNDWYHRWGYSAEVGKRLRWVSGRSYLSGQSAWLPACRVFLPYRPKNDYLNMGPQSSRGLALAMTLEDAVEHGLSEWAEYSAEQASLQQAPHGRPRTQAIDGGLLRIILLSAPAGWVVVRSEFIPASETVTGFGIAARRTFDDAVQSATEEAVADAFSRSRGTSGERASPWSAKIGSCVNLEASTYFVDITPADIAALGFVATRCLITGYRTFPIDHGTVSA